MGRIEERFHLLSQQGRPALIVYVTAGDPSLAFTQRLIPVLARAGADVIEIGIPFSDPLADGPTIQAAAQRALQSGVTVKTIFEMIRRVRTRTTAALTVMSYANPLFHHGYDRIAQMAVRCGIDGFLVPDLPFEEAGPFKKALKKQGIPLIPFLAPTTGFQRARRILGEAEGFVYYVSLTGTTGARPALPSGWQRPLMRFKRITRLPVCVGFGLSTADQVREAARRADGVVIGSALIQALAACRDTEQRLRTAERLLRRWASALA